MKHIRPFISEICREAGFSKKEIHGLVLAVDEGCTNIMRHSYQGDSHGLITLECQGSQSEIVFVLKDRGLQADKKKIYHRALEEVRPGGLGVFFIQKMMDRVSYERHHGVNILRMKKYGQKSRI